MSKRDWLVNEYCRLVNENISFIQEHFEGIVPAGRPEDEIYWKTKAVCEQLRALLEEESRNEARMNEKKVNYVVAGNSNTTEAEIDRVLEEYLKRATEYFEQGEPWNTREQNRKACRNTILNSLQMIANLTFWLDVLGEETAHEVSEWLELDMNWKVHCVHSGQDLGSAERLELPAISFGA